MDAVLCLVEPRGMRQSRLMAIQPSFANAQDHAAHVQASSARLVEPVAVLILPPLRQTKKPPFRVAFFYLVEPGGIEPSVNNNRSVTYCHLVTKL